MKRSEILKVIKDEIWDAMADQGCPEKEVDVKADFILAKLEQLGMAPPFIEAKKKFSLQLKDGTSTQVSYPENTRVWEPENV